MVLKTVMVKEPALVLVPDFWSVLGVFIGPNWCLVLDWTGQSSPIFKTMDSTIVQTCLKFWISPFGDSNLS